MPRSARTQALSVVQAILRKALATFPIPRCSRTSCSRRAGSACLGVRLVLYQITGVISLYVHGISGDNLALQIWRIQQRLEGGDLATPATRFALSNSHVRTVLNGGYQVTRLFLTAC